VRLVVDNAALGPTNGEGGLPDGPCGPELFEIELPFVVAAAEAPSLPPLSPPAIEVRREALHGSFDGVTCCPGVVPEYDDGSCEGWIYWPKGGDCAFLYEEAMFYGVGAAPVLPAALEGQVWYRLFVDDMPVASGRDADGLRFWRGAGACSHLEATHLGSGLVVTSAQACLSPEEAASLGAHALELDSLTCSDGQVCSMGSGWSLDACVPLDPELLPPPPSLSGGTTLSPDCGGPAGPWVDLEVSVDEDDGTTGAATDGTGEDADVGCGCHQGGSTPLFGLGVRRRRA
jgi:hypothetical protein